jgi:hypothetical protein
MLLVTLWVVAQHRSANWPRTSEYAECRNQVFGAQGKEMSVDSFVEAIVREVRASVRKEIGPQE